MPQGRRRYCPVLFLAALLISAAPTFRAAVGASSVAPHPASSQSSAGLKYQQGWLGGDAAYSIPLGDGRSLWVFGDTFIAKTPDAPRGPDSAFIRNSIGITSCPNGKCSIEYFWGHKDGKPDSMFSAPGADWLWPMDGFVQDGTLYIAMMQMHVENGGGAMGFDFSRIVLASIPNYTAPPDQWKVSYQLLSKGGDAIVGVSIVVRQGPGGNPDPKNPHGADYAYFFTLARSAGGAEQHLGLARIALNQLGNAERPGSTAWEYLRGDQSWAAWTGTDTALPKNSAVLLRPGATEMTVRYHEATKQWLAAYPVAFQRDAQYALSDSITRGWKSSKSLYEYPEMNSSNANYTPHVFCYAVKEHVEFEKAGQLVFSYACNSTEEKDVLQNSYLYHPIVVTQPFPK
jgi:Domain of unknown function (DUF4185)